LSADQAHPYGSQNLGYKTALEFCFVENAHLTGVKPSMTNWEVFHDKIGCKTGPQFYIEVLWCKTDPRRSPLSQTVHTARKSVSYQLLDYYLYLHRQQQEWQHEQQRHRQQYEATLLLEELRKTRMGQLLGLPSHAADNESFDCRPKNFSECFVNGKVNGQRYLHYKKRSHEESLECFSKILFSKSLLEEEATIEAPSVMPAVKKKRREKQVVMYIDPVTGERRRLYPMMSLW
jgi:hypothetical protein